VLQASTNLATWVAITTNTASANQIYFVDPRASNFPARYYRVLQP
jgi:hypothetical protein